MKPFDYTQIHKPVLLRRLARLAPKVIPRLYKPLTIIGEENIPAEGAFIAACNHIHSSDPVPMMLAALGRREIHFMAKYELFKNPVAARIIIGAGGFPVRRGIGARRALEYSLLLLRNGHAVGIFPEGTRHPGGPPQEPRTGTAKLAFETGAPVLPCALYCPADRPFGAPLTLRIGRLIPNGEIDFGDGKAQGRRQATVQIMGEITKLWAVLRDEYQAGAAAR